MAAKKVSSPTPPLLWTCNLPSFTYSAFTVRSPRSARVFNAFTGLSTNLNYCVVPVILEATCSEPSRLQSPTR
ncbi:hypothetical protein BDW75DRAFT_201814 [Aspergillus navahoensis]